MAERSLGCVIICAMLRMLREVYNIQTDNFALRHAKKKINDCSGLSEQYCMEWFQTVGGIAIRKKPITDHPSVVARAVEEYSSSTEYTDRNVSELDVRVADLQ